MDHSSGTTQDEGKFNSWVDKEAPDFTLTSYDGKKFNLIYSGGSNAVKQGKAVNEYIATCVDQQLTLYINGEQIKSVKDTKYNLPRGKVGFGVSSFDTTPIVVGFDWISIEQP